jgi:DNA (cytosine-5)-methyltransferase 1
MIKLFEMFAGVGGASFALTRQNIPFECIGYSEINKFAIKCYNQNHIGIKNFGDCTKINPQDIPDFDLLTGGFPCQAFSQAGKRLGELDTRGTLFNEIIRIAEVKKPIYMLLENVKGLTTKKHKATFDKILSELQRIGYNVNWKILNSKDYGIPQNRERVWFVCFRNIEDYNNFKWPETQELKIYLKDVLEKTPNIKYNLSEKCIKGEIKSMYQERKPVDINKICSCLKIGGDVKCIYDYITKQEPQQFDVYHFLFGEARPLSTFCPQENKISRCLQAGLPKEALYNKGIFRRLTPLECMRLMGFNDGELNINGLSDSAIYKLMGNGWTLNPSSLILKNMLLFQ